MKINVENVVKKATVEVLHQKLTGELDRGELRVVVEKLVHKRVASWFKANRASIVATVKQELEKQIDKQLEERMRNVSIDICI